MYGGQFEWGGRIIKSKGGEKRLNKDGRKKEVE